MSPLPIRGCDADQARKTRLLSVCLLATERPDVRWHQIISTSRTNKIKKKKKRKRKKKFVDLTAVLLVRPPAADGGIILLVWVTAVAS